MDFRRKNFDIMDMLILSIKMLINLGKINGFLFLILQK